MRNLPIIYDGHHLAKLTGTSHDYIFSASNSQSRFYRSFKIKKRNGKLRAIDEPLPTLKNVQRWVLANILARIEVSKVAKAFVKDVSIKDNARFHRNQNYVISIDVRDFFPSIPLWRVYAVLRSQGYSRGVSYLIAKLCTLDDKLPQGAPTSPAISNIVLAEFDSKILDYTRSKGLRYTRYADDLTVSGGTVNIGELLEVVRVHLEMEGLHINDEKTKVMRKGGRQIVTGIVVNKKLSVKREIVRDLRKNCYYIKKFGLDLHLLNIGESRGNYINHLMGIATHILHIDKKNKDAIEALDLLKNYRRHQ